MPLPPRTKVRRPDLADTTGGDRIGWVAPSGHYPTVYEGDFLSSVEDPNARQVVQSTPPDTVNDWIVVWWQGSRHPDGTRGPGFYRWEPVGWLEVLELPDSR